MCSKPAFKRSLLRLGLRARRAESGLSATPAACALCLQASTSSAAVLDAADVILVFRACQPGERAQAWTRSELGV
jgi:hypothetical protein